MLQSTPLTFYEDFNAFKLFLLDCGLFGAMNATEAKDVVPVEVKAEENLRAKSLRVFVDKYSLPQSVRISMCPYREQEWVINVPLYATKSYFE